MTRKNMTDVFITANIEMLRAVYKVGGTQVIILS